MYILHATILLVCLTILSTSLLNSKFIEHFEPIAEHLNTQTPGLSGTTAPELPQRVPLINGQPLTTPVPGPVQHPPGHSGAFGWTSTQAAASTPGGSPTPAFNTPGKNALDRLKKQARQFNIQKQKGEVAADAENKFQTILDRAQSGVPGRGPSTKLLKMNDGVMGCCFNNAAQGCVVSPPGARKTAADDKLSLQCGVKNNLGHAEGGKSKDGGLVNFCTTNGGTLPLDTFFGAANITTFTPEMTCKPCEIHNWQWDETDHAYNFCTTDPSDPETGKSGQYSPADFCGCVSGFTKEDLIFPEPKCITCGDPKTGSKGSVAEALECEFESTDTNAAPMEGACQLPTIEDLKIDPQTSHPYWKAAYTTPSSDTHCPFDKIGQGNGYDYDPLYKKWKPLNGPGGENGKLCGDADNSGGQCSVLKPDGSYECKAPENGAFKYGTCVRDPTKPNAKFGKCECTKSQYCTGPYNNAPGGRPSCQLEATACDAIWWPDNPDVIADIQTKDASWWNKSNPAEIVCHLSTDATKACTLGTDPTQCVFEYELTPPVNTAAPGSTPATPIKVTGTCKKATCQSQTDPKCAENQIKLKRQWHSLCKQGKQCHNSSWGNDLACNIYKSWVAGLYNRGKAGSANGSASGPNPTVPLAAEMWDKESSSYYCPKDADKCPTGKFFETLGLKTVKNPEKNKQGASSLPADAWTDDFPDAQQIASAFVLPSDQKKHNYQADAGGMTLSAEPLGQIYANSSQDLSGNDLSTLIQSVQIATNGAAGGDASAASGSLPPGCPLNSDGSNTVSGSQVLDAIKQLNYYKVTCPPGYTFTFDNDYNWWGAECKPNTDICKYLIAPQNLDADGERKPLSPAQQNLQDDDNLNNVLNFYNIRNINPNDGSSPGLVAVGSTCKSVCKDGYTPSGEIQIGDLTVNKCIPKTAKQPRPAKACSVNSIWGSGNSHATKNRGPYSENPAEYRDWQSYAGWYGKDYGLVDNAYKSPHNEQEAAPPVDDMNAIGLMASDPCNIYEYCQQSPDVDGQASLEYPSVCVPKKLPGDICTAAYLGEGNSSSSPNLQYTMGSACGGGGVKSSVKSQTVEEVCMSVQQKIKKYVKTHPEATWQDAVKNAGGTDDAPAPIFPAPCLCGGLNEDAWTIDGGGHFFKDDSGACVTCPPSEEDGRPQVLKNKFDICTGKASDCCEDSGHSNAQERAKQGACGYVAKGDLSGGGLFDGVGSPSTLRSIPKNCCYDSQIYARDTGDDRIADENCNVADDWATNICGRGAIGKGMAFNGTPGWCKLDKPTTAPAYNGVPEKTYCKSPPLISKWGICLAQPYGAPCKLDNNQGETVCGDYLKCVPHKINHCSFIESGGDKITACGNSAGGPDQSICDQLGTGSKCTAAPGTYSCQTLKDGSQKCDYAESGQYFCQCNPDDSQPNHGCISHASCVASSQPDIWSPGVCACTEDKGCLGKGEMCTVKKAEGLDPQDGGKCVLFKPIGSDCRSNSECGTGGDAGGGVAGTDVNRYRDPSEAVPLSGEWMPGGYCKGGHPDAKNNKGKCVSFTPDYGIVQSVTAEVDAAANKPPVTGSWSGGPQDATSAALEGKIFGIIPGENGCKPEDIVPSDTCKAVQHTRHGYGGTLEWVATSTVSEQVSWKIYESKADPYKLPTFTHVEPNNYYCTDDKECVSLNCDTNSGTATNSCTPLLPPGFKTGVQCAKKTPCAADTKCLNKASDQNADGQPCVPKNYCLSKRQMKFGNIAIKAAKTSTANGMGYDLALMVGALGEKKSSKTGVFPDFQSKGVGRSPDDFDFGKQTPAHDLPVDANGDPTARYCAAPKYIRNNDGSYDIEPILCTEDSDCTDVADSATGSAAGRDSGAIGKQIVSLQEFSDLKKILNFDGKPSDTMAAPSQIMTDDDRPFANQWFRVADFCTKDEQCLSGNCTDNYCQPKYPNGYQLDTHSGILVDNNNYRRNVSSSKCHSGRAKAVSGSNKLYCVPSCAGADYSEKTFKEAKSTDDFSKYFGETSRTDFTCKNVDGPLGAIPSGTGAAGSFCINDSDCDWSDRYGGYQKCLTCRAQTAGQDDCPSSDGHDDQPWNWQCGPAVTTKCRWPNCNQAAIPDPLGDDHAGSAHGLARDDSAWRPQGDEGGKSCGQGNYSWDDKKVKRNDNETHNDQCGLVKIQYYEGQICMPQYVYSVADSATELKETPPAAATDLTIKVADPSGISPGSWLQLDGTVSYCYNPDVLGTEAECPTAIKLDPDSSRVGDAPVGEWGNVGGGKKGCRVQTESCEGLIIGNDRLDTVYNEAHTQILQVDGSDKYLSLPPYFPESNFEALANPSWPKMNDKNPISATDSTTESEYFWPKIPVKVCTDCKIGHPPTTTTDTSKILSFGPGTRVNVLGQDSSNNLVTPDDNNAVSGLACKYADNDQALWGSQQLAHMNNGTPLDPPSLMRENSGGGLCGVRGGAVAPDGSWTGFHLTPTGVTKTKDNISPWKGHYHSANQLQNSSRYICAPSTVDVSAGPPKLDGKKPVIPKKSELLEKNYRIAEWPLEHPAHATPTTKTMQWWASHQGMLGSWCEKTETDGVCTDQDGNRSGDYADVSVDHPVGVSGPFPAALGETKRSGGEQIGTIYRGMQPSQWTTAFNVPLETYNGDSTNSTESTNIKENFKLTEVAEPDFYESMQTPDIETIRKQIPSTNEGMVQRLLDYLETDEYRNQSGEASDQLTTENVRENLPVGEQAAGSQKLTTPDQAKKGCACAVGPSRCDQRCTGWSGCGNTGQPACTDVDVLARGSCTKYTSFKDWADTSSSSTDIDGLKGFGGEYKAACDSQNLNPWTGEQCVWDATAKACKANPAICKDNTCGVCGCPPSWGMTLDGELTLDTWITDVEQHTCVRCPSGYTMDSSGGFCKGCPPGYMQNGKDCVRNESVDASTAAADHRTDGVSGTDTAKILNNAISGGTAPNTTTGSFDSTAGDPGCTKLMGEAQIGDGTGSWDAAAGVCWNCPTGYSLSGDVTGNGNFCQGCPPTWWEPKTGPFYQSCIPECPRIPSECVQTGDSVHCSINMNEADINKRIFNQKKNKTWEYPASNGIPPPASAAAIMTPGGAPYAGGIVGGWGDHNKNIQNQVPGPAGTWNLDHLVCWNCPPGYNDVAGTCEGCPPGYHATGNDCYPSAQQQIDPKMNQIWDDEQWDNPFIKAGIMRTGAYTPGFTTRAGSWNSMKARKPQGAGTKWLRHDNVCGSLCYTHYSPGTADNMEGGGWESKPQTGRPLNEGLPSFWTCPMGQEWDSTQQWCWGYLDMTNSGSDFKGGGGGSLAGGTWTGGTSDQVDWGCQPTGDCKGAAEGQSSQGTGAGADVQGRQWWCQKDDGKPIAISSDGITFDQGWYIIGAGQGAGVDRKTIWDESALHTCIKCPAGTVGDGGSRCVEMLGKTEAGSPRDAKSVINTLNSEIAGLREGFTRKHVAPIDTAKAHSFPWREGPQVSQPLNMLFGAYKQQHNAVKYCDDTEPHISNPRTLRARVRTTCDPAMWPWQMARNEFAPDTNPVAYGQADATLSQPGCGAAASKTVHWGAADNSGRGMHQFNTSATMELQKAKPYDWLPGSPLEPVSCGQTCAAGTNPDTCPRYGEYGWTMAGGTNASGESVKTADYSNGDTDNPEHKASGLVLKKIISMDKNGQATIGDLNVQGRGNVDNEMLKYTVPCFAKNCKALCAGQTGSTECWMCTDKCAWTAAQKAGLIVDVGAKTGAPEPVIDYDPVMSEVAYKAEKAGHCIKHNGHCYTAEEATTAAYQISNVDPIVSPKRSQTFRDVPFGSYDAPNFQVMFGANNTFNWERCADSEYAEGHSTGLDVGADTGAAPVQWDAAAYPYRRCNYASHFLTNRWAETNSGTYWRGNHQEDTGGYSIPPIVAHYECTSN